MANDRLSDLDNSLAIQVHPNLDGLSYEEYFKKVDEMIGSVRQHWDAEQRVKSLKVVIQLAKLLADTSQIKLYAKKYKMIVDLLDEFGTLVHKRIHSLAASSGCTSVNQQQQQAASNGCDDSVDQAAMEKARDTCRNWFLKVASIRELVPRFYTEISIIKCCDILLKSSGRSIVQKEQLYLQTLMRLTKAAWGFGDPIVALHARAYLCKVANQLIIWNGGQQRQKDNRDILFEIIRVNLKASVIVVSQLNSRTVTRALRVQNVSVWSFFELLSNCLQTICNIIAHQDDFYTNEDELSGDAIELFETMLSDCLEVIGKDDCPLLATNIVLNSVIRSMPASIIVKWHLSLWDAIKEAYKSWIEFREVMDEVPLMLSTFYATLESFALALDASRDFEQEDTYLGARQDLMAFARATLDQLVDDDLKKSKALPAHYIRCFKAWLSYSNHYLDSKTVDAFLGQFIWRFKQDKQHQHHHHHATMVVELIKALTSGKRSVHEFRQVFATKSFQSLLDLLNGRDDLRLESCKLIFETMRMGLKLGKNQQIVDDHLISDKRMIDFMVKLFSIINDSLSLLAADDDIQQLSQLVVMLIQIVSIPDYVERLYFLSKCRSSMGNLKPVLEYLAREALKLAGDYRILERRRLMRRNFLNGCLAFTLITIPALDNPLTRLELLIGASNMALEHMSLSLADYHLKQILLNLTDLVGEPITNEASDGQRRAPIGDSHQSDQSPRPVVDARNQNVSKQVLVRHAQSILDLMLKHQDYIDLRYKLALSDLIEGSSLSHHTELLEQSEFLKAINDKVVAGKRSNDNDPAKMSLNG